MMQAILFFSKCLDFVCVPVFVQSPLLMQSSLWVISLDLGSIYADLSLFVECLLLSI